MRFLVFVRMAGRCLLKKLLPNWKNFLVASTRQKIVFVVGPTASGKSAWALEQAVRFKGSIVNIDSIQFYENLLIGSAAPSKEEKSKAPHYLYSYVTAPTEMTAGQYIEDFYELLKQDIQFPLFIVGGTGFYIQALEKGMFNVEPIDEKFREEIESELLKNGAESLYAELKSKDPASLIHLNDHFRLVRAIEIIRHTGKIPSQMKSEVNENKNALKIPSIKVGFSFEKEIFSQRIKNRTEKMIAAGLVAETQSILENGFENWAPLASVGYKETVEHIKTQSSIKDLKAAIEQSTMKLIKKQKTWFKRDDSILWSDHSSQSLEGLKQKIDPFLMGD
jgi:tRNA dimethylallyltransferase